MNSKTTICNDFPPSRSTDNLNFPKVLLSAQNTSTSITTQQQNVNIADTQLTVVGSTDKTSPNKTLNTKVLLMSPFLGLPKMIFIFRKEKNDFMCFLESRVEGEGQTSFLLSPVAGGLDKNKATNR